MHWRAWRVWVLVLVLVLAGGSAAEDHGRDARATTHGRDAQATGWWNAKWRYRVTVARPGPWRSDAPRPVEAAIDFPLLLQRAGLGDGAGAADVRVVERATGREVPFAARTEPDARTGRPREYLAWLAKPRRGQAGAYDVYFNVKPGKQAAAQPQGPLPPENLLANAGFRNVADGLPVGWQVSPAGLVCGAGPCPAMGRPALKVVVDDKTPAKTPREAIISQKIDVGPYAGCEMVFACDLLAERARYGAPVSVEIEQLRKDGSRIGHYAVQPRWLTIELAAGQLVRLRQRGRFSHDAASAVVRVRMRCSVRDADTREYVTGPESHFTVRLGRVVVRPAERWPWPGASGAGFVDGAMADAPVNRAFEFTSQRRVAFNGASEGTLTAGKYGNADSVHWGLAAGTLEFWCRPRWNADDGAERVFFTGVSYGHRRQSRLRKRDKAGGNRLEFSIADAGGTLRTVRGPAKLRAGRWHHVAATWDFGKAALGLFVDGERIGRLGPGAKPWPASTVAVGGEKKSKGIGISETDTRSLPMQAFIGGGIRCRGSRSAEAAIDELRISDVARYADGFKPAREEFRVDSHTRALWHFENGFHGTHDADDRFVRGHPACELPPLRGKGMLAELVEGKVVQRPILIRPGQRDKKLFQAHLANARLPVTRPLRKLPDPRFVALVPRQVERTLRSAPEPFELNVGGAFQPLMRATTFERAAGGPAGPGPLPRWRANDNVVPFSAADLTATLAPDAETDAAKAFEAFKYALKMTNYYDAHYCETLPTRHRPRVAYTLVKAINIYPFDQCGPLNYILRKLFLAVGVSSNDAAGTHHQFEQAYYGGDWRLFDLSPRVYWLERDNQTVAGRRDFEEDMYLKVRQGSGVTSALRGRPSRARFAGAVRPHRMDFPMAPGERVSVCWHNEGRWFEVTGDRKPVPLAKLPPMFGNGAIVYEPRGASDAAAAENLAVSRPEGPAELKAADGAKAASLAYRCRCPYILSGAEARGAYRSAEAGGVRLLLSVDRGKTWKEVWRSADARGAIAASLLRHVTGRYEYELKLAFAPGSKASVEDLAVRTTFVVSPLSLPGRLRRGANRIRFVGAEAAAPVRTSCRWIERHRAKLGASLDALSYYLDGGRGHRSVIVAAPGRPAKVAVTLAGEAFAGDVAIDGLPAGWLRGPASRRVKLADAAATATATFDVVPTGEPGEVHGFGVSIPQGEPAGGPRRLWGQILLADAPLVREAENADRHTGKVAPTPLAEASGRRVMAFGGDGTLGFDFSAARAGTCALWLRARWLDGGDLQMTLALDGAKPRRLRPAAMIGFSDWTDPSRAHTKMFAHYGEQYAHWSWYRIPAVKLEAGKRRLTIGAAGGARLDAVVLLPASPAMDRAAMNLFQNWNYAPWLNPM